MLDPGSATLVSICFVSVQYSTCVVDPKLFFPDPDPTLTLISDPDSDSDPDLDSNPACL